MLKLVVIIEALLIAYLLLPNKFTQDSTQIVNKHECAPCAETEVIESCTIPNNNPPAQMPQKTTTTPAFDELRTKAKIKAIKQFINTTPEQEIRLEDKFKAEQLHQKAASLEDVLGKEQAEYYREQLKKSWRESQKVSNERDIYWLSRKLNLNSEQEKNVFQLYDNIEKQIEDMQLNKLNLSRFDLINRRLQIYEELQIAGLKDLLTEEQFKDYTKIKTETPETNFGIWHASE